MSWIARGFRHSVRVWVCVAASWAWGRNVQPGDDVGTLLRQHLGDALPSLSGKVVLVDFWASWCAPCRRSFPEFDKLQKEYQARGFLLVAVSVDEDVRSMQRFLEKIPVGFTVLHDVRQALVTAMGVETMPTSFLLDQTGRMRFSHNGYAGERTLSMLRSEIESLLKEGKP